MNFVFMSSSFGLNLKELQPFYTHFTHKGLKLVPAAAGIATQDDLQASAAHGAIRLVAIFIIAI